MASAGAGEAAARRRIVAVCRRLYERGLIAGAEGNVSLRSGAHRALITPAGVPKAQIRSADVVLIDLDGRPVGRGRPSTEVAMHVRIYRRRTDVAAIVHAHPPVATGFAVVGEGFDAPVLAEVVYGLGSVALVPYAMPGTESLADQFDPVVEDHNVFLLSNHGATTVGPSLAVAYERMESLEHSARILLAARLLGRLRTLTAEQVRDLVAARESAGRPGAHGAKTPPGDGLETE